MEALLVIVVLIGSIVVHEVAHAWQARREGDDTAEKLGRITLNPIPHLDPLGSFIVPALLYLSGSGIFFGWARPVPVNPLNYRNYVAGDIRVSMAGIVSNLVLAAISTLVLAVLTKVDSLGALPAGVANVLFLTFQMAILINLVLAFFNLLPIPPLDGSHVVAHILPEGVARRYRDFGQYGILALMGIIYFVPGALGVALSPVYFLSSAANWFVELWI
jgi:Zn-dependent protease